jgi:hypothetical protein
MLDPTPTLDLSRLRVLENIKVTALGASQAVAKRIDEMNKRLADRQRQLNHARHGLEEASRRSTDIVTEGMGTGFVTRWKGGGSSGAKEHWKSQISAFEAECNSIEKDIEEAEVSRREAFEQFNESSHLHDACKAFASEYLRDEGDDR